MTFNFKTSYKKLNSKFFSEIELDVGTENQLVLLNERLLEELEIKQSEELLEYLSGSKLLEKPIAMAYAGHQFGHFTMLGDGRAALLGEHILSNGARYDIQLKGSGRTPYSRGGDGKATVSAMLREYIYSEALAGLKIATSRSIAVISTGEKIYRQQAEAGALLVRVMQSHIRVGTFQYASHFLGKQELTEFTDYAIARHYSGDLTKQQSIHSENKYLNFFELVMDKLIDTVVDWLRVGFIHGVMNTDNISITGETFDYGPCAFMNSYDLSTVFSSVDTGGRYAYGKQSQILLWNLVKFAEALIPIIAEDEDTAIKLLTEQLDKFNSKFSNKFELMFKKKLGISAAKDCSVLINRLLQWLSETGADYTNTFIALQEDEQPLDAQKLLDKTDLFSSSEFIQIKSELANIGLDKELMRQHNPYLIPRNYLVEAAIAEYANNNSLQEFTEMLAAVQKPYEYSLKSKKYQQPPLDEYDSKYKTYCNT